MEIRACPSCGSKNIFSFLSVEGWNYLCKDCGFQGDPFILNTEKDYQNFLKGLKKKKRRE
jgi:DNA-directed RNA polymerase subunit RPC12/RpoP